MTESELDAKILRIREENRKLEEQQSVRLSAPKTTSGHLPLPFRRNAVGVEEESGQGRALPLARSGQVARDHPGPFSFPPHPVLTDAG